ncbi:MAG: DNA repair protein RecO [Halanaerobiales bacterium]
MGTTYIADTIVLKQFDLGEADKIITFSSRERGQIRAVAANARKSGRFSGAVQPFNYNNITFYQGKSLDRINHVENKYSFSALRDDLKKMAYASYMAEVVEKVGVEGEPQPDLFSLLLSCFHKLISVNKDDFPWINFIFKLKALSVTGHRPRLDYCPECGTKIRIDRDCYFDIAGGGLFCGNCSRKGGEEVIRLSPENLEIMERYLHSGLDFSREFDHSDRSLKILNGLLDKFITYHLDISIKSLEFLHMIENFG